MKALAEKVLGRLHFNLEQVQDLTPTPMTLSSVMFYTGENPYTHEPVYVARSQEEKRRQKSYFFGAGGKAASKGRKGPGNGREEFRGSGRDKQGFLPKRVRKRDESSVSKRSEKRLIRHRISLFHIRSGREVTTTAVSVPRRAGTQSGTSPRY